MTETSELLPCANCGGIGELGDHLTIFAGQTYDGETSSRGWSIRCGLCGCQTCWWHHEAQAIVAWNRRPSPQPIESAVSDEAVEAAAKIIDRRRRLFPDCTSESTARAVVEALLPHLHPSPDNTGEPVAWRYRSAKLGSGPHNDSAWVYSAGRPVFTEADFWEVEPLYLHPPAADAVVEVLKETRKQLKAIVEDGEPTDFKSWLADVEAALSTPQQAGGGE